MDPSEAYRDAVYSRTCPFVYREKKLYSTVRDIIDKILAGVAIVLLFPMLCIVAAIIKLSDGGPVFFTQIRVGKFGRLFKIVKFRTMRTETCTDALSPTSGRDQRITTIGKFLRRTSIDELPQLINIINGEMAIVGPRPEMPFLVAKYRNWQNLRLCAKPGITGLWQITHRSKVPLHHPEATLIDLEYIKRASTMFDGLIVLRTVGAIVSQRGAF